MASKFVVFAAFVAVARASGYLASPHLEYAAPLTKTIVHEQPAPAHYDFGYAVSDPLTGDHKSQQEIRRGDVVEGSYSLLDADGTTRTVDYTADALNGFNAVVHKDEPVLTEVATPITYAAQAPLVAKVEAPVVTEYAAPLVAKVAAPLLTNLGLAERAPLLTRFASPYLSESRLAYDVPSLGFDASAYRLDASALRLGASALRLGTPTIRYTGPSPLRYSSAVPYLGASPAYGYSASTW